MLCQELIESKQPLQHSFAVTSLGLISLCGNCVSSTAKQWLGGNCPHGEVFHHPHWGEGGVSAYHGGVVNTVKSVLPPVLVLVQFQMEPFLGLGPRMSKGDSECTGGELTQ